MTVRDALREGAAALAGTETPFLDASLLLAAALAIDTTRLLASSPEPVSESVLERFRSRLALRSRGLPIAYILGHKEFWGRVFAVDRRVLVPRPDTETLVAAALALGDAIALDFRSRAVALRVHEACAGSGCVAISLAADRPEWAVSASDISDGALEVASANARALLGPGGRLQLTKSDLLAQFPGPFEMIVANPPYVTARETDELLGRGWSEPRLALDGGVDGLDLIRRLLPEAGLALSPGGAFLVEASGEQAGAVADMFRGSGFIEIETLRDLAGKARVTSGRKPWTT
jgi:release factor glutamine methyltransferase